MSSISNQANVKNFFSISLLIYHTDSQYILGQVTTIFKLTTQELSNKEELSSSTGDRSARRD